jgi:hypothetical protein
MRRLVVLVTVVMVTTVMLVVSISSALAPRPHLAPVQTASQARGVVGLPLP